MKAEIITIGTEILIGQIVDTNAAWIGEQFNLNGIEVYQITTVHDDHDQIMDVLSKAVKAVDLVIITGGLGPTNDDITRTTLCEFFDTKLVFHESTFERIKKRFKNRNISINKQNCEQAMIPEDCIVLPNNAGSAPGMLFEKDETIIVSVPGVPFEMKCLVSEEILPRLRESGKTKAIFHKTVLTQGIPESMLAEKLESWENNLPSNIKLAYLPNPMAVRLRLSAMGENQAEIEKQVEDEIIKLLEIIPEAIFGYDNDQMAEIIGRFLIKNGKTLAVAESCTGGNISHLITSVAGSSAYFKGAVTAYSNEIKQQLLGVSEQSLIDYGAVSKEVAQEMAEGAKKALGSDFAISTTGIAGPTGGTDEKPVGTVWIAVSGEEKTIAKKFIFGSNRERNILRTSQTALQLFRRFLLKEL